MRARGVWWGVAGLLGLAAFLGAGGAALPPDPHRFMDDEARCGQCHHMEPDGQDWFLDPHIFIRSVAAICKECHPDDQIGRSHPVEVDPYEVLDVREIPAELPLQSVDGDRGEFMTCGTCHNPHADRLSPDPLYSRQRPYPGSGGLYLTYYLRMRAEDPEDGFTPLCHACHPDM